MAIREDVRHSRDDEQIFDSGDEDLWARPHQLHAGNVVGLLLEAYQAPGWDACSPRGRPGYRRRPRRD